MEHPRSSQNAHDLTNYSALIPILSPFSRQYDFVGLWQKSTTRKEAIIYAPNVLTSKKSHRLFMNMGDKAPRPRSFRLYDVMARNIQPHSIDNRTGHLLLKGAQFQNAIYSSPVRQRHCVATKAKYVSPSRSTRFHWVSKAGQPSKRLPVPYGKIPKQLTKDEERRCNQPKCMLTGRP
jgi:hypothetical protein